MSTQEDHKVVNLYREQITAYHNAREAVKQEVGDDVSEGEVVKELACAYTGHGGEEVPESIANLIDDHASNHGDPVVSYATLQEMNAKRLRRMAQDADSDNVTGRHTRMEWYSYFGRGGANE